MVRVLLSSQGVQWKKTYGFFIFDAEPGPRDTVRGDRRSWRETVKTCRRCVAHCCPPADVGK